MRKFRLKVGLDVDDVLFSCNEFAVELENKAGKYVPPLQVSDIKSWDKNDGPIDNRLRWFKDQSFFKRQPVLPGAKEFVRKLSKKAEVFIVSAVTPEFMGIRTKRLLEEFPELKKENIILGSRKDLIKVDVLLDDAAHNLESSISAYPVLMRRPWNRHMTGGLAVNTYGEFLSLIDIIQDSYIHKDVDGNKFYVLVGPSGSGKTTIMEEAVKAGYVERLVSYTTRSPRKGEINGVHYHFINEEEFAASNTDFFETTCYAGEMYGSSIRDVANLLSRGNGVAALDICGAVALKKAFPGQTKLIYISRPKRDLYLSVLERNLPKEETANRLLSIEGEEKNEELCDETIHNNGSVEEAMEQFKKIVFM